MQRGETLERVAATHGCTTEVVERANHVETSLVPAGTAVEVPDCGHITNRARVRGALDDDAKAKQALAVIDGALWIAPHHDDDLPVTPERHDAGTWVGEHRYASAYLSRIARTRSSESVGAPWQGRLAHASKLETDAGYIIKRPTRAFGTAHLIEYLRGAIGEVRALYPNVPTLAIGDISAEYGGKITDHRSHQCGLDVDVGFYFTSGAATFFADANSAFDLEANWALLAAFTRTAALDDGVLMIFLDYDIQHRLYDFAKRRGTPDSELEFIFQYPRGRDELSGLVRHWPGHGNHFHVRFKP